MTSIDGNREQTEYWNGAAAARWVEHQVALDRALSPFGDAALERLAPCPGDHVVDVGCGSGATLLDLSPRVGSTGTLLEADAAEHAFAPSFHALFSRFGVMFFADPLRAFQNLKRALVPGGRLVFACWQGLADNPWCAVPLAAAREALGELPPQPHPQ